jgi:hypothetical protein
LIADILLQLKAVAIKKRRGEREKKKNIVKAKIGA